MAEDRLKKDYDLVENLDDLITAREDRVSAFADDVDGMEDITDEDLPVDASEQLTWPHPKTRSQEYGREGINVDLMDTPSEQEIEFDWQDSAEEMLPTDPEPNEGMGADDTIESVAHLEATDLVGPAPSVDISPELDTAATEDEEKYEMDGGEPESRCPVSGPIPLEDAMETDSDEMDFSIEDKFAGQVTHETAEYDFEEIRRTEEEEEAHRKGE